ncbi:MAG: GatB/YqeY domain-containing protein [Caldilineaceae bacterium]
MSEQTQLSLQERINADLKRSMLERNDVAKLALRSVKTALTILASAGANHELSEAQVMAAIRKEIKQRRDSATEYEKLGAPEKAVPELAEAAVLEQYLPAQMSEEQIEEIVRNVIAETGATSPRELGKVMAAAMTRVNGLADGKAVNAVARRLLSGD